MFIGLLTRIANASNLTKCVPLNDQQCMNQPTLIPLHPSNKVKDYVTIHFLLIQINTSEVVILLMTCLIKYTFQTKHNIHT